MIRSRRGSITLIFICAVALLVPQLMAQTTGRVEGRTLGQDGSGLPGVTLTVTSPNLQGAVTAISGSAGTFRFLSLPPGSYVLRASLDGFNTLEQQNVVVGIERTVSLTLEMSAAIEAEVIVTAQAPVVDVTSSSSGINLGGEVFKELPLARDLYAVAQMAAGSGSDRHGTTIYGATSVENQYIIDGLNTTGVETGQENKRLNVEFIEEVQVITGGLNAEYGRITGGVINAVTKSGGNNFKGDVFGYFADDSLQADNTTAKDLRSDAFITVETGDEQDYGFDVGGYIIKDKLWFFSAFDQVAEDEVKTIINPINNTEAGTPQVGDVITSDIERDLWAGKLTFSINESHRLTGSVFADPQTKTGSILGRFAQIGGPPSTFAGTRESGGTDYSLRYDGLFGDSWLVEANYGSHNEEDKVSGPGKTIVHRIDQSVPGSPTSGGFPFHQDQEFEREVFRGIVSKFFGDHEFKFGADQEDLFAENNNFNGGAGQRIYKRRKRDGFAQHFRHRFYVDSLAAGFDADDPSTWTLAVPLTSTPETSNTSLFVQDTWRLTSNFTLNLGGRFERQEIGDRFGASQIDLDDNYAARIGMTWDVRGDGRSKAYANYGRYFLSIPMDINIRAFGGEVQCFCYNFSDDPNDFAPDASAPEVSRLLGAGGTPVDPELKGQYIDEFLLGYEFEVRPNFALGVQATYRDLGRVVEDFLIVAEANYFIANPGEGLGTDVSFYDYYFSTHPNGDAVGNFTAPVTGADREYIAVQFTARKRYSDNWQLLANYVWSRLEGTYDGAFQVSTGQLDPTINSAFDYADFLVNADGKLSLDREHQFRVDGSYLFSDGWADGISVGATAFYKSGFPLNAYGYSAAYNNNELFIVPRGSLGRGPDTYEIDVHVGYPIDLGGNKEINLLLDVFNLLDRQSITRLDERFSRPSDDFCDGIDINICSNMGGVRNQEGTLNPIGSVGDVRSASPNPDFLRRGASTRTFTEPRTIRVGVRFSF